MSGLAGRARAGRGGPGDGGQLLLLAGIILVLMFVVTSITLSEMSSIETDVAREHRAPIADEYDFVETRLNETMNSIVSESTTNSSFNTTLDSLVGSFEGVQNSKGYDLVVELGGATTPAPKTEDPHFIDGGQYANVSFDGRRDFTGHNYDGVNDGILWYEEADDDEGHIKGFVAYIYLADEASRIEGTVLFAVNVG